jgi:hypothetical protein
MEQIHIKTPDGSTSDTMLSLQLTAILAQRGVIATLIVNDTASGRMTLSISQGDPDVVREEIEKLGLMEINE